MYYVAVIIDERISKNKSIVLDVLLTSDVPICFYNWFWLFGFGKFLLGKPVAICTNKMK